MVTAHPYSETVVPRAAVSFPLRLPEPEGFDPERHETWPHVTGRLEYVDGSLWFMPPCGDDQQYTTADVVTELNLWRRLHPEFVVGTNEAGMKLGADVRGADGAVWRRADLGERTGGFHRVPPVLAVEVAGIDDTVEMLRNKARWYLAHGVEVVWLLVPDERTVIVITAGGEQVFGPGDVIPERRALPGLTPRVADLFRQLDEE
jgi:Uma2 family endonuclease